MGRYFIDLTGQIFGKLTVIHCVGSNKNKVKEWLCKCECGNERIIISQSLINGNTKSCGCIQKDKHDLLPPERKSRKYAPIVCGIYRVTNPNGEVYIGGSRTIYKRWLRHREGRKNLDFHKSIKKYGWESHKWEIVHELPKDISNEFLIVYEQFYIDAHRSCGINMLNAKDAGSSAKFSNVSKQRMSAAQRKEYEFMFNGKKISFIGLKQFCQENGLGERQMSQVYNNNGFYGERNYYKGYSRVK